MNSKIPGTAKALVESLIVDKDYSVKQIAARIGVTDKTIYKIRRGCNPQPKTHLNLIQLYLSCNYATFTEN